MSWSAVVFGDMKLDEAAVDAWRRTPLDASKLQKGDLGVTREIVFLVKPITVERALSRLPREPLEFVTVLAKGGVLTFRGMVHEDTLRDFITEIACLAVAAGEVGGDGTLQIASPEEDFLTTVRVRGKRVEATSVTGYKNPPGWRAVQKARESPGYREVLETVSRALDVARGGPRPPPSPAPVLSPGHAAIARETLARLEAIPAPAFMAAAAIPGPLSFHRPGMPPVTPPKGVKLGPRATSFGPLTVLGTTPRAILDYLRAPFSACEAAALRLLHRASPDAAEPVALQHVAAARAGDGLDDTLGRGVADALADRASDASLEALVDLLAPDDPFEPGGVPLVAAAALASHKNPEAGARALARLERAVRANDALGIEKLVAVVGTLRHKPAGALLKTLSKKPAFALKALTALQIIAMGDKAPGFHVGPRGGWIPNKRKPRSR